MSSISRKLNVASSMIALTIVASLSAAAFCSRYSDFCELLSHLRLLYLVITLALMPVVLLLRSPGIFCTWIFVILLNALPMVHFYFPGGSVVSQRNAVHVKILQANLWGGQNQQTEAVLANVRKFDPDVFAVSEITQSWKNLFDRELSQYKYSKSELRFGGIAVYSKLPLTDSKVEYFGEKRRPRIEATVQCQSQSMLLIAAHPLIPKFMKDRNGEFAAIASVAARSRLPVVVAGDLNCSPWSYYFEKLLSDGRLIDSEVGFGLQCSWPNFVFKTYSVPPFIPIDHFLVSKNLTVVVRQLGVDDGSDHLPVFVEIALPEARRNSDDKAVLR